MPCEPLFPGEADAALEVFKALRMVDVAGQPTFGEASDAWVFEFVRVIFGSYNPDTAKRLIREFFLLISKKNGKSTLAAGIMLTALIRNWRHSAELLILAPTLEVANNAYRPAADMVRADPELYSLLHIQDNFRQITHRITKAALKVVAADTSTVGGKKASFVLVDELWDFGKKPNADAMLREATGGLVSRPEGFVIYLSTQSDTAPAGVFKAKLDYFRDVRDGRIQDAKALPVLYEFPPDMLASKAYLEPANFYVTNPNLGRSVSAEWLEDELVKARSGGFGPMAVHLAKHLNVEIGLGLNADRWAGAEQWAQRADTSITLAEIIRRCGTIVVGIDGGGLDDLLGMAVWGRTATGQNLVWNRAWAHESVLERRKSEAARLRDLESAGDIAIVSRMGDAFEEMAGLVQQVDKVNKLAGVALDPAGVDHIIAALAAVGIEDTGPGGRVQGVSQGWKLSGAIKDVEVGLSDGTLRHAGQALMSWCVGNAKAEAKGNAITITKQAAGTAKIDPLVATFIAGAVIGRVKPPPSYQMLTL